MVYTLGLRMQYKGVVCNEEGKLEGLPLNRALRDEDGDIYSFLKLRNAAAAISEGGCVLSGSVH